MKIERMNKGEWGKLRAYFDLATSDGFIIKGFKLVDGINGLFVSMPSQKGNDEEYYDTIWVESKQLKEELTTLAINTYNESTSTPTSQTSENPKSMESVSEPEATGDNLTSEVPATPEDAASSSFSDDDIPF